MKQTNQTDFSGGFFYVVFSNGYIKELDLIAYEREDVDRLLKFMYQGE